LLRLHSENDGSDADDRDAGATYIDGSIAAIAVDERIASASDAMQKAEPS
jgi:hypothetical protein